MRARTVLKVTPGKCAAAADVGGCEVADIHYLSCSCPPPPLLCAQDVIMNLSLEKQTQTVQKVASTTAESKHGL